MGYYTYHTGKIVSGNVNEREVALAIARLPYWNNVDDDIEYINDVIAYVQVKWYSCINDMKEISAQFPGVTIKIHGEGEENGDLWDAYFKNGKAVVYKAQIVYPAFKEEDLR